MSSDLFLGSYCTITRSKPVRLCSWRPVLYFLWVLFFLLRRSSDCTCYHWAAFLQRRLNLLCLASSSCKKAVNNNLALECDFDSANLCKMFLVFSWIHDVSFYQLPMYFPPDSSYIAGSYWSYPCIISCEPSKQLSTALLMLTCAAESFTHMTIKLLCFQRVLLCACFSTNMWMSFACCFLRVRLK